MHKRVIIQITLFHKKYKSIRIELLADYTKLNSPTDRFCPVGCLELFQYMADMSFDGVLRDKQIIGDLSAGLPFCQAFKHIHLPST